MSCVLVVLIYISVYTHCPESTDVASMISHPALAWSNASIVTQKIIRLNLDNFTRAKLQMQENEALRPAQFSFLF